MDKRSEAKIDSDGAMKIASHMPHDVKIKLKLDYLRELVGFVKYLRDGSVTKEAFCGRIKDVSNSIEQDLDI